MPSLPYTIENLQWPPEESHQRHSVGAGRERTEYAFEECKKKDKCWHAKAKHCSGGIVVDSTRGQECFCFRPLPRYFPMYEGISEDLLDD